MYTAALADPARALRTPPPPSPISLIVMKFTAKIMSLSQTQGLAHPVWEILYPPLGCVVISVNFVSVKRCQDDIFPRIELSLLYVLSSRVTDSKNDIQLFHQLFDELSVNRDYH